MKKFGSRKEELADTWSEGKSEAINIRLPYVRRQITQRLVADKIFSTEKEADRFFHDEILPRLEKQWMSKAATDNAVSVLKGGKKPAKKRTEVKPEQPVADLFGGLFDEPISNEKKTDVQPRPGTAERERGHEPRWERANGMKLKELTDEEWVDVVASILCLTESEAQAYLESLRANQ